MKKNEIVDKLAIFVKNQINQQNISIKELAKKSNISEDYWRKIIRSEIKAPSFSTIENIALGFNISLKTLLENLNEIDILNEYLLTQCEANDMIEILAPYLEKSNIQSNTLSPLEKFELSNYLMLTIKMCSNKYIK